MALLPPPSFVGKIIIVSGENDTIHWFEDDGTEYNLSDTLTSGEYWPDEFITMIQGVMDLESANVGANNTYEWSFSIVTGIFSIEETSLNGSFYLKAKITDTTNVLFGKGTDSSGNPFSSGQWGRNGIGWMIVDAYPSDGSSAIGDRPMKHFWSAEDSPQSTDDGKTFISTEAQASSISGQIKTYDFSGWEDDATEFPIDGGFTRQRKLAFEFVTSDKKDEWIHNFWGPYGKSGKVFRYYIDSSLPAYDESVLIGERIKTHGMEQRLSGYKWWTANIDMQRQ